MTVPAASSFETGSVIGIVVRVPRYRVYGAGSHFRLLNLYCACPEKEHLRGLSGLDL